MKNGFLFSLIFAALAAGLAAEAQRAATVVELHPKVDFVSALSGKKALKAGVAIFPGDKLATGAMGNVAFATADGSLVRLGSNTEIVLKDARAEGKGSNLFQLAKGLLQAMVSKQGDGSFSVSTVHGVAAVKGTQWQIEEGAEHCEVKVLSGTVEVQDPGAAHKVELQAGEATISYKDRVDSVRKMGKDEMDALKKVFAARVFQVKKDYAERVKKLKGN